MSLKSYRWALAGACALVATAVNPAFAAGTYYVGTTVASNSVLWAYAPTTNLVKLCFETTSNTLACTATQAVFPSTPGATDNLQYRISQNSQTGGLWIVDLTSNKEALCEAAIPSSTYVITCALGAGLK
jgi:hypothetical protein